MFFLVALTGCASTPRQPSRETASPPSSLTLDDLPAETDVRRNELVLVALSQVGVPYAFGGIRPEMGFDCSGLVGYVYWQVLRVALPRTSYEQARVLRVISGNDLRAADLVFFNTLSREFSHVGLYIGDGRFVHAPATGSAVRIDSLRRAYWQERWNGARRAIAS